MKGFLVLIASVFLLPGCSPSGEDRQDPSLESSEAWQFSRFDPQVDQILGQMSLDEKIGQMTQADQAFLEEESDIETYFLGSLLSGGDSDPPTNSLEDWTLMVERYQQRARSTRLGIPLLYGVDAVHGHNNVLGAVVFPHNIGLGATRNAELVERIARVTAREVRATAINWAFAPCVAVPRDLRWGRTYEGFSEDPRLVAELGRAVVRGLQGVELSDPLSVLACAKHYVGDGGTSFGSGFEPEQGERWPLDRGDTRMDEDALRRIHLPGYITAIQAGVGTIMPSYSSWNGAKCSGSRRLLTEILKEELGFEGFLISDYDALDQLPGDYKANIALSINAGMDMVMVPAKYRTFVGYLKELVQQGAVPLSRIDDAVRRILRVKVAMGLLAADRSLQADRDLWRSFGSEEHRELAREAVRQSLVLLKNDNDLLPISRDLERIHVAGKNADDLGNQSGGWTITWQGSSGPVPAGTTILGAIRSGVLESTTVTYSLDGSGASGADAAIAVIGETPYAEGLGDRPDLGLSPQDVEVVRNLKNTGVPVVVILVSGRPLIIEKVLENADAFLAAWLPGTEGGGVADVLFGDFPPSGRLPFSWPREGLTLPLDPDDPGTKPLFPYGFGMGYGPSR